MSIFKKILLLVFATICVLVTALCVTSYVLIARMADESSQHQLFAYSAMVQHEIERITQSQETFADILQDDIDFARAIAEKDTKKLYRFAKDVMRTSAIDFVTICDAKGVVLVRGHDSKSGDTLPQSRIAMKVPLTEGKIIAGMETGSVVKLTLAVGIPMRFEDKIVGVAILGTDLASGKFVDMIKKQMQVECTIFLDDTRISTTIMREGRRAEGTRLDNAALYERVMVKNEKVVARNNILGMDHDSAYWPWKNMEGKNAGMLFVGVPRAHIERMQYSMVLSIIAAGLLIGACMLVFGSIVARAIVKPLRAATVFAENVSRGDLDGSLVVTTRDEAGVLSRALGVILETLKAKMQ